MVMMVTSRACSLRAPTQQDFINARTLPILKSVTPFARTAPSWKHAFPGTPGMHTIELMVHNQTTLHKLTKFT